MTATARKHRPAIDLCMTIDHVFAGILPYDPCDCGDPASDHLVKMGRGGVIKTIRCQANCPCTTYRNRWGRA